jgi:hypothetical protein
MTAAHQILPDFAVTRPTLGDRAAGLPMLAIILIAGLIWMVLGPMVMKSR